MMNENIDDNAPAASSANARVGQAPQQITARMIDSLQGTYGWAMVLAVLAIAGAAFMILGGVFMMVGGGAAGLVGGGEAGLPGIFMVIMGVVYIGMSAMYLLPAMRLYKFARAAGLMGKSGNDDRALLEEALEENRLFWKTLGILMVGGMALMMLFGMGSALLVPLLM